MRWKSWKARNDKVGMLSNMQMLKKLVFMLLNHSLLERPTNSFRVGNYFYGIKQPRFPSLGRILEA